MDLVKAQEQLAALPRATKQRLYRLIRQASEVALTDREVHLLAAILWAQRGEGLFTSLEAGYKLFLQEGSSETGQSRSPLRPIETLTPAERRKLLAELLSRRHKPQDEASQEQQAGPN